MSNLTRTFRLFVSSTFSDFQFERNALQMRVFPRLRDECRKKGFQFQPIDLRWGVTEEAGWDQRTTSICLDELRRCLATGLRPAVLILLGQRYGGRPLPEQLLADDFTTISHYMGSNLPEAAQLLHLWYRHDDNAVPSEYRLRPRDGKWLNTDVWTREVESPLRLALVRAVHELELRDSLRIACERSLTEREIRLAFSDINLKDHAIACLRTISTDGPLPPLFSEPETNESKTIEALRRQLWDDVTNRLGANCRRFNAKLINGEVDDTYLDEFCQTVYDDLWHMMSLEMTQSKSSNEHDQELEIHQRFAKHHGRLNKQFFGRDDELRRIREYLNQPTLHPLIVVGQSGVGKSALLARIAVEVVRQYPEWVVVHRFIGTTPASTDERLLLKSLCKEIDQYYPENEPVPESYTELVDGLRRRLARATVNQPLLLILDGLDQLQLRDVEKLVSLIPTVIPSSLHFIVSVLHDPFFDDEFVQKHYESRNLNIRQPQDLLQQRLPQEMFLRLKGLSEAAAETLIKDWLSDRPVPRRLQPEQYQALIQGFRSCNLPLYLQVATEEAAHLRSYDPTPKFADGLLGLLCEQFFKRLAQPENHLPLLVERVAVYLSLSKHGLMEDELLELLACDKSFMQEFVRRSAAVKQPLQDNLTTVPMAVWIRLYSDLQPFVLERIAEDGVLLDFYHKIIGTSALLWVDLAVRKECMENLLDYFRAQDCWAEPNEIQREKLLAVPPQPRKANLRKVMELPLLLIDHEPSRKNLKESLFDPDLLEALCESGRVQLLLDLLRVSSRYHNQRDVAPIDLSEASLFRLAVAVMAHKDFLERHPTTLFQVLFNYFRDSSQWPDINEFLSRWRQHKEKNTPGFPWLMYRATPPLHDADTSLTISFRHNAPIAAIAVSPLVSTLVCGDYNGGLRAYRVMDGNEIWSIRYREQVNALAYSPDGKLLYVACWEQDTIRELDAFSGTELRILGHLQGVPLSLAVSPDGKKVVAGGGDNSVYIWDTSKGRLLHKLLGHSQSVMAVCFAMRGKLVASGGRDNNLFLWDSETGQRLAHTQEQSSSVEGLCCLSDEYHIASAHANGSIAVWKVPTLERVASKRVSRNALSCIAAISTSKDRFFNLSAISGMEVVKKWLPLLLAESSANQSDGLSDWIIVGSDDTHFYLWTPRSDEMEQFSGHTSHVVAIGWDPHSEVLCPVTGSHDQTVRIWGYPRPVDNREHGLGGRHDHVSCIQTQPLGFHFAWCAPNSGLFISNIIEPKRIEKLLIAERPFCCDFSQLPNNNAVLAVGTETGKLMLFSPDNPLREFHFTAFPVRNVRFSPDDKYIGLLLDASYLAQVVLLTFPDCRLVGSIHLPVAPGVWLSGLAVAPEGRLFAIGGNDNRVQVFEYSEMNGKNDVSLIREFSTDGQPILDLEFDLSGQFLVGTTGSVNGHTFTWDIQSNQLKMKEKGYIHPRTVTHGLINIHNLRARNLATEIAVEVAVASEENSYHPIAWLPNNMSYLAPDISSTHWVGLEGQHLCLIMLQK